MDFMDLVPDMLRGPKKPAKPPVTPDGALPAGVDATGDPAYAAYVREAKSMGEPVMTRAQFHKR